MKKYWFAFALGMCVVSVSAQTYWNTGLKITSLRLPLPPVDYKVEYLDLNNDGTPDAIKSVTRNDTPILWLDDDGNMKVGDIEGDMINDCLLIDRNKDGIYDLVIDWVDTDNDGCADIQFVIEYPIVDGKASWGSGHYMIMMDLDKDNIFNYIDWNSFELRCWDKQGISNFYEDYSGHTAFMKIHTPTYDMKDLRLNWENPFLFYDPDHDGLTEMAIRMVDSPKVKDTQYKTSQLSGSIDWVSIAVDMDNDNAPGNEFDFDFTIGFQGPGFSYLDQKHPIRNLRGLPEADKFFVDPRYRMMTELIYPNHESALDLIFNRGKWTRVNFVFDEDDDCNRWERVEFYDPADPFKVGWKAGGIDNNKQSDAAGDRGEWDMDNSGKGKLYISRFDGRLHLYGAEQGIWRVDQNSFFYQGWDRMWLNKDPGAFATVRYTDTDGNGFFDCIEYDWDGDKVFEETVTLKALGIDDRCDLIDISNYRYEDYVSLMQKMADDMWKRAENAVAVAKEMGVQTLWYAKWMNPASVRERYHYGYWLQYYLFKDIENHLMRTGNKKLIERLAIAYYTGNWKINLSV